jgi:hypothetical protein
MEWFLVGVILCLAVVCVVLAYKVGLWKGKSFVVNTTVSTKKTHIPRYRPDNLLDPVSPEHQRLERMLNRKEDEDREGER